MTVSADAIDADGVRQTLNTAVLISVGHDNIMLGNIDADCVTILMLADNTTRQWQLVYVDAILILIAYVKRATRQC